MGKQLNYTIKQISAADVIYASSILDAINESATKRGTGIEDRPQGYIEDKMNKGLGVIVIDNVTNDWIGFCTLEVWKHKLFLANTGLIIQPEYRGYGISAGIKSKLFDLCRQNFPKAKILSMTTNPMVIASNEVLGFTQVSFAEILKDPLFVEGCTSWVDYVELMKRGHSADHDYLAMVYYPNEAGEEVEVEAETKKKQKVLVA